MTIDLKTMIFLILIAFGFLSIFGCTKTEYINTKIVIPQRIDNDCKLSGYENEENNMSMESFGIILTDTQCLVSNIKSRDAYIKMLIEVIDYHNSRSK